MEKLEDSPPARSQTPPALQSEDLKYEMKQRTRLELNVLCVG